jgi:gliding motility-associated-like protein
VLKADGDEENNSVDLHWRSYQFWTSGNVSYEILKSLKVPKVYELAESEVLDTVATTRADESFIYFFRVKAVREDGLYNSLSNEVELEFNHELEIPNVITPNEDGFNDTFEIKNIKLYPRNRLIIVNRYGKTMFDQPNYAGGWNGGEGTSGVYYFTLQIPEKQKEYKGWLQVIR